MTVRGKSINIFLMDGKADGRIKCTLANWTGIAYKIPRTDIEFCKDRDDLKQSGVYFLFGVSDETGENVVYIGQAGERKNGEGLLYRLQEHKRNQDKDYWTEAIVFTTANNSFGPTEISYLEHRFCKLANEANRYVVKNGNEPSAGHITEEKECELEEFIEFAQIIMGTLGHKVFIPHQGTTITIPENSNIPAAEKVMQLKHSKLKAHGRRTSDGFVVLKDSQVAPKETRSCPGTIRNLRQKYADKVSDNYILKEDVGFNSPSAAAGFVTFSSINGMTAWVDSDGNTLKDLDSNI